MQQSAAEHIGFFESVLNAFPSPVLVVDKDMEVVSRNTAAAQFFDGLDESVVHVKTGALLSCLHTASGASPCGTSRACANCVIRNSVHDAIEGHRAMRRRYRMRTKQGDSVREILLLVTTAPFLVADRTLVLLVLEDISELAELKAMIPICANCKKIRDDQAYWHHVEAYLQDHLDLQFTHGLCPDCVTKLYPQAARTLNHPDS